MSDPAPPTLPDGGWRNERARCPRCKRPLYVENPGDVGWASSDNCKADYAGRDDKRHVVECYARALDATERERDAYKRAKSENDDRFMGERDEARAEVERLRRALRVEEARTARARDDLAAAQGERDSARDQLEEALRECARVAAERNAALADAANLRDEKRDLLRNYEDAFRKMERERDGLAAARYAYASEFAPNVDGEPDVGSVHENIRALKADRDRLRALVEAATDFDLPGGFDVWLSDGRWYVLNASGIRGSDGYPTREAAFAAVEEARDLATQRDGGDR